MCTCICVARGSASTWPVVTSTVAGCLGGAPYQQRCVVGGDTVGVAHTDEAMTNSLDLRVSAYDKKRNRHVVSQQSRMSHQRAQLILVVFLVASPFIWYCLRKRTVLYDHVLCEPQLDQPQPQDGRATSAFVSAKRGS